MHKKPMEGLENARKDEA